MSGCNCHTNGKDTEYSEFSVLWNLHCTECFVCSFVWMTPCSATDNENQRPRAIITEYMFIEYMNRCFILPTFFSALIEKADRTSQEICPRPALQSLSADCDPKSTVVNSDTPGDTIPWHCQDLPWDQVNLSRLKLSGIIPTGVWHVGNSSVVSATLFWRGWLQSQSTF